MEKNIDTLASTSLPADNHDNPQQSRWLQVTLSDLNKRTNAVMTLLKDDGHSSVGTEIYDNRRMEFIQILEEFNVSHRSLAEKYDQLRSKLYKEFMPPSSSNSNNKNRRPVGSSDNPNEVLHFHSEAVAEDPDIECDNMNIDVEHLNKLADEFMLTEPSKVKFNPKHGIRENQIEKEAKDFPKIDDIIIKVNDCDLVQATASDSEVNYEQGNTWPELNLQVTRLMQENMRQQAELAKRNVEKTLIINRLQKQLEHLKGENRALQSCISCLRVGEKRDHFQISKLRGLFSGKFFGGGSS